MTYRNILLDTNICLDVILDRKPFTVQSGEVINKAELGIINAHIAAHSFDTLFYIMVNTIGRKKAYQAIKILRDVCVIADVTQQTIDDALKLNWPDFEDAIHYQAALKAGCEAVVTRNPNDFQEATLPILSPQELLTEISEEE